MKIDIKNKLRSGFTLVLGGGGVRGLAHIGVLKSLERMSIVPSLIVGTSMGAIVGGLYAQNPHSGIVESRLKFFLKENSCAEKILTIAGCSTGNMFGRRVKYRALYNLIRYTITIGLVDGTKYTQHLEELFGLNNIEDCLIPFAPVATDLTTGQEVAFVSGPMATTIAASSALPGIFAPISLGENLLVDGGVTSLIPTLAARRLSPAPIIAVDVSDSVNHTGPFNDRIDVLLRTNTIKEMTLRELSLANADLVIRTDLTKFGGRIDELFDEYIKAGQLAAESNLKEILEVANQNNVKKLLTTIHQTQLN